MQEQLHLQHFKIQEFCHIMESIQGSKQTQNHHHCPRAQGRVKPLKAPISPNIPRTTPKLPSQIMIGPRSHLHCLSSTSAKHHFLEFETVKEVFNQGRKKMVQKLRSLQPYKEGRSSEMTKIPSYVDYVRAVNNSNLMKSHKRSSIKSF